MFRVVRMMLADILVLDRHIYPLINRLAEFGKVELVPSEDGARRHDKELSRLSNLINRPLQILHDSGLEHKQTETPSMDCAEAENVIESFLRSMDPLRNELETLRSRLARIHETLPGLMSLQSLEIGLNDLSNLEHVILKYGTVPTGELTNLVSQSGSGSLILPLTDAGEASSRQVILAASSRTGRFSLETLLTEHGFVPAELPDEERSGAELVRALVTERDSTTLAISQIEARHDAALEELRPLLDAAITRLEREQTILTIINGLPQTESTARIRCWVPRTSLPALTRIVDEVSANTAVIETLDPITLPAQERQELSIPVILRNSRFFKPFESLISNYGYPAYGEIEPTPLVAIGFVLMFGVMFGDLGQGLVLFLAGLGMALRKRFSSSLRQAGLLIASAGLSAAFFGLVFGSFFCLEGIIHPLWHEPLKAFDNILVLFAATVAFGVLWISTGLVCNIANKILFRDWEGVFLGKTGLSGLAFYWGAILPIVFLGLNPEARIGIDTIMLSCGIPLFLVIASEPLAHLARKKPAFPHGFGTWAIEAVIEGIDTVTWFFGNTFSFVRIGAFALAHGGLSLAVIEMTRLGGGGVASAVIFVGGNLLIIVLEGMVVTIQTLRLEYYEFFSKFYSGSGRPFVALSLSKNGHPH